MKIYIWCIKTSTQNLVCSQHQLHTVHTCKLSQAKTMHRHSNQVQTAPTQLPPPKSALLLKEQHSHDRLTVFRSSRRVLTPLSISSLSWGVSGHGYSEALNLPQHAHLINSAITSKPLNRLSTPL